MGYTIPLFDLNFAEEERDAVLRTLESKWISMGPNVKFLEENFENHLSVAHAVATTNCTTALHLALRILGIREGDEVIVPSLTFVATVNVVRYVGATPVFADITSYEDFSIDPNDVESKITENTKAIIPMHYGGFGCDMSGIMSIAKSHDLFVVEDAAHAPDSDCRDQKLGTIGDFGCFSLFSNKNITCGEGGVLVTSRDEYARKAKLLRSHGMTNVSFDRARGHATSYDVEDLGYNYRMDDIRAGIALAQLKKLPADVDKRAQLRERYLENLASHEKIIVPYQARLERSSNYIFPIVLRNGSVECRDATREKLAEKGIETSIHYPAVHRFSIYQKFACELPVTDYVSGNEITLPLYNRLTIENIEYISEVLKDALRG